MARTPQYTASPKNGAVFFSTANTNRDGTGTLATIYAATATGDRIDDLTLKAVGSTTGGMLRLFLHNGAAAFLWREVPVPANTASTTNPAWEIRLEELALLLQTGWSLRVSTHNAEGFNAIVTRGGPF